jgi:hypothetical protein
LKLTCPPDVIGKVSLTEATDAFNAGKNPVILEFGFVGKYQTTHQTQIQQVVDLGRSHHD